MKTGLFKPDTLRYNELRYDINRENGFGREKSLRRNEDKHEISVVFV